MYRILVCILFVSDSLYSVWGHSVHFAKFQMLRPSKKYCSHSFHSISTKCYEKLDNQVGIEAIGCFSDLPKLKKNTAL